MSSHALLRVLEYMMHSPIQNYGGIPGVTSWLVGARGENGLVRVLESTRDHQEPIILHSHRFDFHCTVLAGCVRNILWVKSERGDLFQASTLTYGGQPGQYERVAGEKARWEMRTTVYQVDEQYAMRADEVHSIFFERGTVVLFFEGQQYCDTSIILEPVVDGIVIPTFQVPEWAFARKQTGGVA